jgi:hypothetical protein
MMARERFGGSAFGCVAQASGRIAIVRRNRREKPRFQDASRLPSPLRHIYNPLTIAVAFSQSLAFDRAWQDLIKVDGTFA